ncbi:hypothetical protein M404DRAFT_24984 [Pisolithus tinctorius Marx 270]|uniref:Uncharacterized protein n=1 Tax=Pisolithus tinctorius Marx 270 TaxID=870435 RepID=A0A0C3K9F8_PISTI|nr:hypothetical protein M404DRAFT_24984 [Pisolithus tinctorius Marx 270]
MSIARMKPTRTELIFRGSPFTTVAHVFHYQVRCISSVFVITSSIQLLPLSRHSPRVDQVVDDSTDLHTRVLRNRKIPTTKMAPPPEVSYLVTVDPI